MEFSGGCGRPGARQGVNEDVRVALTEELVMTDRQQRLHEAGLWLFRCASLLGGVVGVFVFATTLTAQQRLVLVIMVGAVAMPVVLVGLAVAQAAGHQPVGHSVPAAKHRPGLLNVLSLVGAAFLNALMFANPDAYAALALVAVSGALLALGVRVAAQSRPAGQLP